MANREDLTRAAGEKAFIPAVRGIFQPGVYTITSDDGWTAAVADIERNLRESRDRFPKAWSTSHRSWWRNTSPGKSLPWTCISDGEGEPVILNIFTLPFRVAERRERPAVLYG